MCWTHIVLGAAAMLLIRRRSAQEVTSAISTPSEPEPPEPESPGARDN